MNGSKFIARVNLYNREQDVVTVAGDTCEQVDPVSLPWLLDQGYIYPAPEPMKFEDEEVIDG